MNLYFSIALIFMGLGARCQNLVPNSSFEEYHDCPVQLFNNLENSCDLWFNPNTSYPEYMNSCYSTLPNTQAGVPYNNNGFQFAHTGQAYSGMYIWGIPNGSYKNIRAYIEVQLTEPLEKDSIYKVSSILVLEGGTIW